MTQGITEAQSRASRSNGRGEPPQDAGVRGLEKTTHTHNKLPAEDFAAARAQALSTYGQQEAATRLQAVRRGQTVRRMAAKRVAALERQNELLHAQVALAAATVERLQRRRGDDAVDGADDAPAESEAEAKLRDLREVVLFVRREKELVVVSAVRANDRGECGFLSDWRRLNVTLTRTPPTHLPACLPACRLLKLPSCSGV